MSRFNYIEQFIGIYSKSNMTSCHKNVEQAPLWSYSSRFRQDM